MKVKSLSIVQLLVTPWIVPHQAPPSMGFSRQEYWSGVPLPSLKERDNLNQFPQMKSISLLSSFVVLLRVLQRIRTNRIYVDMYIKGLEKAMAPTPVLLSGKSHGQRSLVGYSPWGREELDTTE